MVLGPGARLGNYVITRFVGMGGMASVFEGRHFLVQRRVAIKVLHGGTQRNDESIAKFVREAETAMRIRHPNVLEIHDVGLVDGRPFLVMEYLEGESLESMVSREHTLTPTQLATVLVPIASALDAVHARGVVHRDVKPDNVVLSLGDHGDVTPKLVDFGIAKTLGASDQKHTIVGTPHYMSPEQAAGSRTLDERTDQYAFGVTMYRLLSGRLPFEATSLIALFFAIDRGDYVPLGQLVSGIPDTLERVIARAMHHDATERFPSMREIAKELAPFAGSHVRRAFESEFRTTIAPTTSVTTRTSTDAAQRGPSVLDQVTLDARVGRAKSGEIATPRALEITQPAGEARDHRRR